MSLNHPITLMANALGVPPDYMIEAGKQRGIPVAALVGAKEHAIKQVHAGVDLIVAQGTEAGGHCGEVSTLVLIPEVLEAISQVPGGSDVPVLAAGGIVTGRQMAACVAMGAAGAWTGSVWLTTEEAETATAHQAEDARGVLARHRAFGGPHRQAVASAALGLDRRVGAQPERAPAAAAAAAGDGRRTRAAPHRQAGRERSPGRAGAVDLLRRPGGRA